MTALHTPVNVLTAVAWPYANGPRHIGHVAGFGVPSDVFSRYHRLAAALADLAAVLGGDRPAAVCRELTKTYEQVHRDRLAGLADWAAADQVRGEITLVVAGASGPVEAPEPTELAERVAAQEAAGVPRKQAIAAVAEQAGLAKRVVFDAVVAGKSSGSSRPELGGADH